MLYGDKDVSHLRVMHNWVIVCIGIGGTILFGVGFALPVLILRAMREPQIVELAKVESTFFLYATKPYISKQSVSCTSLIRIALLFYQ